jgi:hypothetical protein
MRGTCSPTTSRPLDQLTAAQMKQEAITGDDGEHPRPATAVAARELRDKTLRIRMIRHVESTTRESPGSSDDL